jgi:ArsR family transcriptional regulator, virulence genes transcriptional regulator
VKPQHTIDPGKLGLDFDAMFAGARVASGFLKALAHEGRLLILCQLIGEEKSVTDIEKLLSLRQPAVSQLLARLRADGLVESRRDGKNVFYSVARPEVREVIGVLYQAFCRESPLPTRAASGRTVVRATARAKQAGRRARSASVKRSSLGAR